MFALLALLLSFQTEDPLTTALAAARDGDTVRVAAGIHWGQFVVNRRIVLAGEPGGAGRSILDGGGRGTVLTLIADSIQVRDLRVTGSGMSLDHDEAAIRVERCIGCVVRDVTVDNALHGIYLANVSGAYIGGNTIIGDTTVPEARRGNGIHLFNTYATRVSRNLVRSTRDGIYFSFSSGNSIDSNDVAQVRYGLHYMYSNDNGFSHNRFRRNAAGGAIMFSDRIVLRNNDFSEHVGHRAYGLLLQTASDVLVENNRFSGNLIGLFVDNSLRNLFRGNELSGNGIAVDLLPSARDNTFTENVFAGNRTQVRIARGSGNSVWAVNGRGNYWASNAVFDLDRDGIGDRPLRIGDAFATLAQARPVLELFSDTPAARALSWAEEALPVFGPLRVTDPAPLAGSQPQEPRAPVSFLFPAATALVLLLLILNVVRRSWQNRAGWMLRTTQ